MKKVIKATNEFGDIKAKYNGKTYNTNNRVSHEEMFFQYRNGNDIVNFKVYQKRRGGSNAEYFMAIEDIRCEPYKYYIAAITHSFKESLEENVRVCYLSGKPVKETIGNKLFELTKEHIMDA